MQLTFEHVTKFYGPVIGINDITCEIGPGITGLLGANGAGKSTLIKLASGQLRESQGKVRVGKFRARSTAARRHLGYSPDLNSFYEEMTGGQFVYAMARLHGFSRNEARGRARDALAEVGMTDRANRKIAGCSHGMRQRIKLAQALVHDPELLLLDEPLSGIDPLGRREINQVLFNLADRGKTILVSSHLLLEIEQLAGRILMMGRGRIVASGSIAQIRGLLDDRPLCVAIETRDARRLASLLVESPEIRGIEIKGDALTVRTRQPAQFFALLGELAGVHQLPIERLEVLDAGADAVFDYLEGGAA